MPWHFETLDGDSSSGGRITSSAGIDKATLEYARQLHVFSNGTGATLSDGTDGGNLMRSWYVGAWHREVLDGEGGADGRTTDVVAEDTTVKVYGGQLHVFYPDETAFRLRHAWWNGVKWQFEALEGGGTTGSPHGPGQLVTHSPSATKFGDDAAAIQNDAQLHV